MRGKLTTRSPRRSLPPCFNEARANCAGNFFFKSPPPSLMACFNEARANCAGNFLEHGVRLPTYVASMRPAQIAREITRTAYSWMRLRNASMRPAQIAREIDYGAGKPDVRDGCFNEARANCAGNWADPFALGLRLPASMRPAQIAREIPPSHHVRQLPAHRFNEARANCAGNSRRVNPLRYYTTGFNEARANCAGNYRCLEAESAAPPELQ